MPARALDISPAEPKGLELDGLGVYKAITRVQRELAKVGIAKDQRNKQGEGFMFRGIDGVYNALAPLLAEHGLCVLPRMLTRTVSERTSKNGGALFVVAVEAEFDFVASEDGSKHTVRMFGEAMDSGDKATNKAMSAAYKYAAFQAFCIPTEGTPDADADTHEVKANAPAGFDAWLMDLAFVADNKGTDALQAEWKRSSPAFRKYLTDTDKATWEGLKASAAKVTAHA